jgi:hypothetical protein
MQWLGTLKHIIFLILLKFQNLWNLINVPVLKKLWKYLFKCFLWFFKVWWDQENQGVTFLLVPPKVPPLPSKSSKYLLRFLLLQNFNYKDSLRFLVCCTRLYILSSLMSNIFCCLLLVFLTIWTFERVFSLN